MSQNINLETGIIRYLGRCIYIQTQLEIWTFYLYKKPFVYEDDRIGEKSTLPLEPLCVIQFTMSLISGNRVKVLKIDIHSTHVKI